MGLDSNAFVRFQSRPISTVFGFRMQDSSFPVFPEHFKLENIEIKTRSKEHGFFLSSENRFLSNWLAFPIPACMVFKKVLIFQSFSNSSVYHLVICCVTEKFSKSLKRPCNVGM